MRHSSISVLPVLVISSLFAISCHNVENKRIVSAVPIKTEVLGLHLGDVSSVKEVEKAISKTIGKEVISDSEKSGIGTTVRVISPSLNISFAGLSWLYVDVELNENKQIVTITLTGSYENIERAKGQFDAVSLMLSDKYGKGNDSYDHSLIFWTDDINSVGVTYLQSSALDGSDRCFCYLYYTNIELADAMDAANYADI